MHTLFSIVDNFRNNTGTKETFEKRLLYDNPETFTQNGDTYKTILVKGNFKIPFYTAEINTSDQKIVLTTAYNSTIKILIILTFIVVLIEITIIYSPLFFQFNINRDTKIVLIAHTILSSIMFIGSRIALFIKRNELITNLKKSKLIST